METLVLRKGALFVFLLSESRAVKPHASKGQGRCVKVSGAKNWKTEFFSFEGKYRWESPCNLTKGETFRGSLSPRILMRKLLMINFYVVKIKTYCKDRGCSH